jgi:dTMP kinase
MTRPIPGGFLVAIDGIDGAGKTTQAQLLAKACSDSRLDHVLSKEPTRGKYGTVLRESSKTGRLSPEEELDLFLKDREEHVEKVIKPALAKEKIVILDRYYFSNAAYQGAHGVDPELILAANEYFSPQPDLLVILDVPAKIGLERIRRRGDKPNKFESIPSLEKARSIFKAIDRHYRVEINAQAGIEFVSSYVVRHFLGAAANKIASKDFSTNGLNRTLELFGAAPILVPA